VEEWVLQELVELFSEIDCSGLGVRSGALHEWFWSWREKGEMELGPCWAFGRKAGLRWFWMSDEFEV